MQAAFPTQEEAGKLLDRLVTLFNDGVRRRDFSEYVNVFDDDAVVDFEGVPERGPLEGKAVIFQRYQDDLPDDEIRITRWKYDRDAGRILAQFVWKDIPEGRGGALVLVPRGDKIARLTIAFGGPACRWKR
jgi:hypothetical protein